MSDKDTAKTVEAMAQAVSGRDTPNHVRVSRPTRGAVWTLFFALMIVTIGVAVITQMLGPTALWEPPTERVALARINGLAWTSWLLCVDIVVLVFAIASPWVGQVKASAGNNSIELGARDDD